MRRCRLHGRRVGDARERGLVRHSAALDALPTITACYMHASHRLRVPTAATEAADYHERARTCYRRRRRPRLPPAGRIAAGPRRSASRCAAGACMQASRAGRGLQDALQRPRGGHVRLGPLGGLCTIQSITGSALEPSAGAPARPAWGNAGAVLDCSRVAPKGRRLDRPAHSAPLASRLPVYSHTAPPHTAAGPHSASTPPR